MAKSIKFQCKFSWCPNQGLKDRFVLYLWRICRECTLFDQIFKWPSAPVVDHKGKSSFQEVFRHWPSHDSQSDKTHFSLHIHSPIPFTLSVQTKKAHLNFGMGLLCLTLSLLIR